MSTPLEIVGERETANGWRFAAQALGEDGALAACDLSLSFADYNLWSPDGTLPPSRVAEAVLRFMLSRMKPSELPAKFNAAQARRMFHDADKMIHAML
jgi:hypothetical protein